MTKNKARFVVAALAVALACSAVLAEAPVTKLRIEVDGKADGNGYINFTFTPATGVALKIEVPIVDRDREESISEGIAKAFKVALGDAYRVDTRGKDEVKIEARDKKNAFQVAVSDLSVKGVSVKLK